MKIEFPNAPASPTVNTTIAFAAVVDGEPLTCEISAEALQDH